MGPRVCHQAWQIGRLDDASWLQRCSLDDQDNHHCTSHQDLQSQSTQEVMMMKINMPNKSDVGRKEPKLVEPNCLCLVLLSHLCLGRGHPCSLCLCSSIPCCTLLHSLQIKSGLHAARKCRKNLPSLFVDKAQDDSFPASYLDDISSRQKSRVANFHSCKDLRIGKSSTGKAQQLLLPKAQAQLQGLW